MLGLLGYLLPAELGGLLEGLERLERRGACWACWGTFCLRSWAFCMRGCAELGGLLEGLERLRPVKRQPGTPIRSHCCGRGDALSHCCGLVVASACGRGACWACWGTVCLRSWAFCMRRHKAWWKRPRGARGMDALTTERYAGKRPARHFKRFKGLKPVKRQP